jgi:hypothetical protein
VAAKQFTGANRSADAVFHGIVERQRAATRDSANKFEKRIDRDFGARTSFRRAQGAGLRLKHDPLLQSSNLMRLTPP